MRIAEENALSVRKKSDFKVARECTVRCVASLLGHLLLSVSPDATTVGHISGLLCNRAVAVSGRGWEREREG